MKVVLIHNLRFGGAYRRMAEQLSHLKMAVSEVTLEGAEPLTSDAVIIPLRHRGNSTHPIFRPITRQVDLFELIKSYRQLHRVVREISPDVIWLNACRYLQAPWLSDDLAQRAVYHCDEPRRADYELAVRQTTRWRTRLPYWPMRRLTRSLDRRTVAKVDCLFTNSEYSVGEIRRAYGRVAAVLRCGVSTSFRPSEYPVDRAHLLSVGSLIPSKGHDLAIEGAALCGLGLPIVIVAPRAENEEAARLESLARDSGVRLVIRIGVAEEDLISLYQSAMATLYMAQAEPFGLASLEAQACGSPVIVSREGGLPETLVQGVTGWAVPRTGYDVATQLATLVDEHLSEEMGAAGATQAAKWSWDASASQLRAKLELVGER
jgi:glycosyltransferase involved in cell wall biosynthesis